MSEKSGSCICCGAVILVLAACFLYFGGYFTMMGDSPACHAIANKKPYIKWMENVTVKRGDKVDLHCQIVNFQMADTVSWKSSKFDAEITPDSPQYYAQHKYQYGVDVASGWTSERFHCLTEPKINGTMSAAVKIFALRFTSANYAHEGWYTCGLKFSTQSTNSGWIGNLFTRKEYREERLYLSVK